MGTIIPSGIVNLLKGVPLDNKYNETVYVTGTQQNQVANFLASYQYLTFNNHEYQRVSEGVLRLNAQIANVYNVNYMIFRNMGTGATYEDHWFFAFVNKVEYVNERAVNIYYEIDVFQTYCLDWTLEPCMVERTHTTTDGLYEHTVAEPVDMGSLICMKKEAVGYNAGGGEQWEGWFNHNKIVIFYADVDTESTEQQNPSGHLLGGIYSGLKYQTRDDDDAGVLSMNGLIRGFTEDGKIDSVVSITMCPQGFVPPVSEEGDLVIGAKIQSFHVERVTNSNGDYTIDGYIPKNKKLLSSPYCVLQVDVQSDKGVYKYELFDSVAIGTNRYNFNCRCSISPNPEIIVQPVNYDGNGGYNQMTGTLVMDGFPQCAFSIDSYYAWLAQNSGNYVADIASKAVGVATGAAIAGGSIATGNPAGIISGTATVLNNAIGLAQSQHNLSVEASKGDTARGTQASSTALGTHQRAIIVRQMCIKAEYARMIDDFFTRFGYAIGRIQTPNLAARKAFTYIKTNGMSIRGAIPSDDMAKINSCFDRGITFFRTLANVGDYSVDNTL